MTLVQGSLALPSSNARTNNWPENTNNKQQNLPLSLELNKALDTVNHAVLIGEITFKCLINGGS